MGSPVGKELDSFFVALFNEVAFLRLFHLEFPNVKDRWEDTLGKSGAELPEAKFCVKSEKEIIWTL